MANLAGKSVFIVYPHNPEDYVFLNPPFTSDPNVLEEFAAAREAHELQQRQNISRHVELVHEFAKFLQKFGVKVTYDKTIADTGCQNMMKWFEDALEKVHYIILIVTPSLNSFLKEDVDPTSEPLFAGNFLYNLVHSLKLSKPFLPVFLDREKDTSNLPTSLAAASVYHVVQPFVLTPRADDLLRLYSLLTSQGTTAPQITGAPVALPRRGLGSSGRAFHQLGIPDPYSRLSQIQTILTDHQIVALSDKVNFNSAWKVLGPKLGLTRAEMEVCEVNAGGFGNSEKCLMMLKKWRDNGRYSQPGSGTIARLANIVWTQMSNLQMLAAISDCV